MKKRKKRSRVRKTPVELELAKYKKKLTKAQRLKYKKHFDDFFKKCEQYAKQLGIKLPPMRQAMLNSVMALTALNYIKYELLGMEPPPRPVASAQSGDPYTCGPQYFEQRHCCHCSTWREDR